MKEMPILHEYHIGYITDKNGDRTHAVIPIQEWDRIREMAYSSQHRRFEAYPVQHLKNVLEFIIKTRDLNVNDWRQKYEEFYSYYNELSVEDIMVLYIFRSGGFSIESNDFIMQFFNEDNEQDEAEFEAMVWDASGSMGIRTVNGQEVTPTPFLLIGSSIANTSEEEFIKKFYTQLSIDFGTIDYFKHVHKRIRKEAERDRLFIYDLTVLFADDKCGLADEYAFLFTDESKPSSKDIKAAVVKYIASRLYNDNPSQVYRAAKEAVERVKTLSPK